jgi:hypothetical protein
MTDISSAAQAVLDAAYRRMDENPNNEVDSTLAAALRAAALHCKRDTLILLAIADELEAQ